MIIVKEIIATLIFCFGLAALITIAAPDYGLKMLFVALICFLLAYLIWPSKSRGKRDENSWFFEALLEFIIEFPIEIVKFVFRMIGRIFSRKDGDYDIDIDI